MEIRKRHEAVRGSYRSYNPDNLTRAFLAVRNDGMSIRKASKTFSVPYSTLQDRTIGKVSVDVVKSGVQPLFSEEHEALLASHIQTMAEIGYGYSRQETMNLATDYAIHLGLRSKDHKPLTDQWLYNFIERWPDLTLKKPRALDIARAKSATRQTVDNYFTELQRILVKYNLEDNPHLIYNVDEKALSSEHAPPKVVAGKYNKTQAVTSGKGKITTLIGCVSAIGQLIPPFFVFPGVRMLENLMEGTSPGADGTMTYNGWSNTEVFCKYMQHHLMKYLPARDENTHVLVLYDGHTTHVSLGLIEWAKSQNIILFVLPPHCSHLLQPLDISCFGPFQIAWNAACHKYLRESGGCVVTRYDVCRIACHVYTSTLTVSDISAAFKKSGIYPFNCNVISDEQVAPSTSFSRQDPPSSNTEFTKTAETFLLEKGGKVLENVAAAKKIRNTLSKVVAGKPITEDDIVDKIKKHNENKKSKPKVSKTSSKKTQKRHAKVKSPLPSTSGIKKSKKTMASVEDSCSSDDEISDDEKCIICKRYSPDTSKMPFVIIVQWGQCDQCNGWVHLSFCTKVRVLRCGDSFICPICEKSASEYN